MWDKEISPSGMNMSSETRQASSLTKILTPQVRFPYLKWILMWISISLYCWKIRLPTRNQVSDYIGLRLLPFLPNQLLSLTVKVETK